MRVLVLHLSLEKLCCFFENSEGVSIFSVPLNDKFYKKLFPVLRLFDLTPSDSRSWRFYSYANKATGILVCKIW